METSDELIVAILFGSLMLALIGGFMFMMVIIYQKKKIRYVKEQQRLIAYHAQTILKAKMEMREDTLKYVGRELHDNIGQLLSLIKLQLSCHDTPRISRTTKLIEETISAVRSLSHDLNIDRLEQYTLADFIQQALNRVQKTGLLTTTFESLAYCEPSRAQDRLMIIRIFQECVSNILKHADAKHIIVKLAPKQYDCVLSIVDDGVGFNVDAVSSAGSGLANIHDRAKFIGGNIQMVSTTGVGTAVYLHIPSER